MKNITFNDELEICGKTQRNVVTVGAGVQAQDIYQASHSRGRIVIAGECPTTGFAGGYIQGGGHSPLSLLYGLAADHLVSIDVVTASGALLTVNECDNEDLFWAISGGGGGTFGVVTSLTVRTFPDLMVSGARLNFTIPVSGSSDLETYWNAAQSFYAHSTNWTEKGIFIYVEQWIPEGLFSVRPFFAPGVAEEDLKVALQPFLTELDEYNIEHNIEFSSYSTFLDALNGLYDPLSVVPGFITGSRLIPRKVALENPVGVSNAIKELNLRGIFVGSHIFTPGLTGTREANNSINPALDDNHIHIEIEIEVPDDASALQRNEIISNVTEAIEATLVPLAPDSGAYLNEANPREPDWQRSFHGDKYPRLLQIKQTYDPSGLFYARTAVGTEDWVEDDETGLLCRGA